MKHVVVVGGTSGIGREIARHFAAAGDRVLLTGRDAGRAEAVAAEIGGATAGLPLDLARPHGIAAALAGVERVDHLVLAGGERPRNSVADYDVDGAIQAATAKLVGCAETVHALLPRMSPDAAVVVFGGAAGSRPSPGSTVTSAVTAGVAGLVANLAVEIAPIRVNAVHPGVVGDSPAWRGQDTSAIASRTPAGRLTTMDDVVDAVAFLLRNRAVNGIGLTLDGGWLLQ